MLPIYHSDVPLHCVNEAAIEFTVPAKLIIAILNVERGKVGQSVRNKNGTYDLGPMQVNTRWLPELKSYSITQYDIQYNPCINVKVGAWILAKAIASDDDFLKGVGNYNSHTSWINKHYSEKVKIYYTRINLILQQ